MKLLDFRRRGGYLLSRREKDMRFSTITKIAAIAALCGGCSTIIEGTSQELYVNTNPAGASCGLMRDGRQIATINPTPGTALVQKTKHDITVVCDRDGF